VLRKDPAGVGISRLLHSMGPMNVGNCRSATRSGAAKPNKK
jgi:hypothetical protein